MWLSFLVVLVSSRLVNALIDGMAVSDFDAGFDLGFGFVFDCLVCLSCCLFDYLVNCFCICLACHLSV